MKKGTKIMAIVSVFILIAVLATFVLKNIHEKKQQRETIDIFEIASEIQETETLMETRKAQETEPETMAETQETEPEIMTEAQETERRKRNLRHRKQSPRLRRQQNRKRKKLRKPKKPRRQAL